MKKILNLYEMLMETADDPSNPELTNWAKFIDYVNLEEKTGWMYVGNFVPKGTIEVEIEHHIFIVLSTSGTERKSKGIYRVVQMLEDGTLQRTDIHTTNEKRGWALRLRDDILKLFAFQELDGVLRRGVNNIIPVETLDLLRQDALHALETGDDVLVYPELLLVLIDYYAERVYQE